MSTKKLYDAYMNVICHAHISTQKYFRQTSHQIQMKHIILSTIQEDKGEWNIPF